VTPFLLRWIAVDGPCNVLRQSIAETVIQVTFLAGRPRIGARSLSASLESDSPHARSSPVNNS